MIIHNEQNPENQIQNKILSAVESVPAFPKSVQEVLRLAQDRHCLPRDLVQVIQHDPVFTLKILKVVNSPLIGLLHPITSIQQASIYLGINTLKHMALNLAAVGILKQSDNSVFSWQDFWWHSLSVAVISKKLAALLNYPVEEQAEFFSAGLLHDVGKLILTLYLPEDFSRSHQCSLIEETMLYEAEQRIVGFNHADIGSMLAEKWGLPETLICGIANHHGTAGRMSPLAACVFTANQIAKINSYGFAGEVQTEEQPSLMNYLFGMGMDEIMAHVKDLQSDLEQAKIFISA